MTVCICGLCEEDGEPKIVIASDRMITTGAAGRIEYEHTGSKIVPLRYENSFLAAGLSSGNISLIEDFYQKLNWMIEGNIRKKIKENPNLNPLQAMPIHQIVKCGVQSYQQILRETVERQVLNPLGLSLDDLKPEEEEGKALPQMIRPLIETIERKQKIVYGSLNTMIAGIDDNGGHIYSVSKGDLARHNSIGHNAIGSGAELARLALIHREYNTSCSVEDALHSVVGAKVEAEEALGVGREMDIAVITRKGLNKFDEEEVQELKEIKETVSEKEEEARVKALKEEEYIYNP